MSNDLLRAPDVPDMKALHTLAPVALALTLAACGGGSGDGGAAPAPVTAPQTAADSTAPGTGPATATATATVTVAPPAAPVAEPPAPYTVSGGGVYFMTPSRNIACGSGLATAGCQVFKTDVIPPGADCDHGTMPREHLSKGYLSMNGGAFTPSCFNQGVFSMVVDQKVLPYGRSLVVGDMTCVSAVEGVTCRRGEHGFFVSAQSFRQW